MKKQCLLIIAFTLFLFSCVKENRIGFKEKDMFEEYEAQEGFVVFHLPPVLLKIFLSSANENAPNQTDLLDKIDVFKVLLFEENEKSIKLDDLKTNFIQKIPGNKFVLLTQVTETNNQVSIYVKDEKNSIREIFMMVLSEKELFCISCTGNFNKEDAFRLYSSINMSKLKEQSK